MFLFFALSTYAQTPTRVEVINADVLEFAKTGSQTVQKLKGNCVFKQDNVILSCDSALKNSETNSVDAYGHVHIQQGDSLNLYGDFIHYDGDAKMAKISNNVRVLHNDMVLTTDVLNYDTKNRIATYLQGGKITSAENILVSKCGYYFAKTADAYFKNQVVLTNPKYKMNSDTLKYNTATKVYRFLGPTTITSPEYFIYTEFGTYNTITDLAQFSKNSYYVAGAQKLSGDILSYDRKKGIGKATNHITFIDTVQNLILKGNKAVYNRMKETAVVTNNAYVILILDQDSLFVSADTLRSFMDKAKKYRTVLAYHDVRAYKSDMQARCDSIVFSFKDSVMSCYRMPTVWSQGAQLSADFIKAKIKDSQLHQMDLLGNAFLVMVDSLDSNKFNQVRGKNMFGYFQAGELASIATEGNGQSVYYARESNGTMQGVNKADCSSMFVRIANQKVQRVSFIDKPDATFYPDGELKDEELKLKGFTWRIQLQPKSKFEVINRVKKTK